MRNTISKSGSDYGTLGETLGYRHRYIPRVIISAPGMWLQRITVREPDDGMIECAIMAFVAVMPEAEKAEYLVAQSTDAAPTEAGENTDEISK